MVNIEAKVREFFRDDDWNFSEPREHILQAGVKGKSTDVTLIYHCREEQQQLVVVGFKPSVVPEEYRFKAAELLVRANYKLSIGSFGMDFNDGEFRFRIGMDVEDGDLSITMVKNVTYLIISMFDQMYPCLMKLIYGNGDIIKLYNEWLEK